MALPLPSAAPPPSLPEVPLRSIQPGGGVCMRIELAWGRFRRRLLRRLFPGYVQTMVEQRQGVCPDCPGQAMGCRSDVIDSRDLKFFRNVCGYHFHPADDPYRQRDHWGLARWGLGEVVLFTLAAIVLGGLVAWGSWLVPPLATAAAGVAVFALWLFLVTFFRDPRRHVPEDPTALVSPADGTVTDIGEVPEPEFPGGRALRISIFLSVFNVHVNRAPRRAKVMRLRYFPGKFLNALRAISAVENEQLWIDFKDEATGQPLRVKQIAGAIARRIVCQLREEETVHAGDRFGMIKVGSRTEVLLPAELAVELRVKVGDKVRGGSTVLLNIQG